ncbi:MAG TPA: HAD hydrolase-like protein [Acidimicrobiales bacterium]|nr:HAD hydrolase-like protein [Acidimicrobiales bacterium]
MGLLVGFDLDGTLVDSRPQILAAFAAVAAETGTRIDPAVVGGRMGLKLEDELGHWFAPADVAAAAAAYRRHYRELATRTAPLPGALAALAAVKAAGGDTAIVTAKHASTVGACLDAAGVAADTVVSYVHGPEKAAVLRRLGAVAYVGDTPPDMAAAVTAGAVGVGVATGSFTEVELRAAGAQVTLAALGGFAACLAVLGAPRQS